MLRASVGRHCIRCTKDQNRVGLCASRRSSIALPERSVYTYRANTHRSYCVPFLSRECIAFSAMLRLPPSMPKEEKLRKVEAVITELNLVKCANTPIGNQFVRGVSGGERKRTAIGKSVLIPGWSSFFSHLLSHCFRC